MAPVIFFSRGTSYVITGNAGDNFFYGYFIPEPAKNGKDKNNTLFCHKVLFCIISICYA
jgi:hypothetical protein